MSDERWALFEDAGMAEGFTQVPNIIIRNPELSMSAKYLYGLLLSYAWEDPYAFPGQKRLKRDCGVKKVDTLRPYLYELKDAEVLDIRRRGQGKTNVYTFKALVVKPSTGGSETRSTGFQETPPDGQEEYSGDEHSVSKNATRSTARKNGTAPRQQEMERIAAALWEKGKLKLDGNEWGYNLKQLSHIYANDEITIDEMERLPEMAVEYMARWKKLDVRKALRAFRADEIELPPKRRTKKGANGSHQQRERTRSREEEFRSALEKD